VRTSVPPRGLLSAVTAAVRQIDRDQPVMDAATMEEVLNESLSQERFTMVLLAAFAGLALLLAAVGIYSVLSYSVRRRGREIGIRLALGAQVRDVLKLVVLEALRPTLVGVALGLTVAFAFGRSWRACSTA
jgi:putative ABC transport system permease protein